MWMKTNFTLLICLLSLLAITGCDFIRDFEKGNGNIESRKREIENFKRVTIGGNFQVLIKESEKFGLMVIADENLHEYITSEIQGNELIITQEKKLISSNKIELIVSYTELDELRIMGAAKLINDGILASDDLTIKMDGAGVVNLNLEAENLEIALSGAGIVNVQGNSEVLKIRLNGAGSLDAFDLISKECDIVVSGIGSAKVFVTDKIDARIEGVGGIEYAGNPKEVITDVSGLGKISKTSDF